MLRESFFLLSVFLLIQQLGFCMFVFYLPFMTYYRINEIKYHKQYRVYLPQDFLFDKKRNAHQILCIRNIQNVMISQKNALMIV